MGRVFFQFLAIINTLIKAPKGIYGHRTTLDHPLICPPVRALFVLRNIILLDTMHCTGIMAFWRVQASCFTLSAFISPYAHFGGVWVIYRFIVLLQFYKISNF